MGQMSGLGRILIVVGIIIIAVGILMLFSDRIGLFKLPGDIVVKKKNFTFYFPLMTSVILSILITLILYIINRYR